MDLPHFFSQSPESRDRNARQSIEALEQIYGYATFNENKYSVLSNWKRAWFFRRAEVRGRKTLYYAKVELNSPNGSSMLKAFVGMVLIARLDWSHSSATPCTPPPSRHFSEGNDGRKTQRRAYEAAMKYSVPIKDKMYPLTPLDYRLCDFGPNWSRTSQGCVVSVSLARQHGQSHLAAICKMVDVVQSPHGGQELAYEAAVYAALSALQGTVIPHFHGYYEVWGILNLLVLEDVGNSVGDDKPLTPDLRKKMKSALACIHRLGYLHGDVARRNFCIRKGKVFVIDFERSTPSPTMAQQQAELELVDSL